ncbi:MAG: hypothetical protein NZ869_03220 [Thermoanaerobaculum sp.]|nr:hypothetical protein [Thermoanaerobaculum sp.]MDW7967265.1 hypothetical protein [Thermoanaerobaculum sp.]
MIRSPWVRGALVLAALAVVCSLGLYTWRVWLEGEFVRRLGPLEPAAYTRPPVRSEANAARYFLAAAGRLRLSAAEGQLLAQWAGEPTLAPGAALAALVARNEAALRLARQGAGLEESFYGLDYSLGFRAQLPDLPQLVSLGRLLLLEARLARERGEQATMAAALAALGSLAGSLQREPGLMPHLAGLGLERLQLSELVQLLADGRLAPARVAQLRQVIVGDEPLQIFARVVGLEEASLRQSLPPREGFWEFWATEYWRAVSARKALRLASLAQRPGTSWARQVNWEELDNHQARLLTTLALAQGVRALRVAVTAALVCARHQGEHGDLPASLAVVPEALKPNPFTGQPLAYSPEEGVIAVPGAANLWQELRLPPPVPPFTLQLALGAGKASGR